MAQIVGASEAAQSEALAQTANHGHRSLMPSREVLATTTPERLKLLFLSRDLFRLVRSEKTQSLGQSP